MFLNTTSEFAIIIINYYTLIVYIFVQTNDFNVIVLCCSMYWRAVWASTKRCCCFSKMAVI